MVSIENNNVQRAAVLPNFSLYSLYILNKKKQGNATMTIEPIMPILTKLPANDTSDDTIAGSISRRKSLLILPAGMQSAPHRLLNQLRNASYLNA